MGNVLGAVEAKQGILQDTRYVHAGGMEVKLVTDHLVEGGGQLAQVSLDVADGLVKGRLRVHSAVSLDGDDDKVVQRVRKFVTRVSDSLVLQKLPSSQNRM